MPSSSRATDEVVRDVLESSVSRSAARRAFSSGGSSAGVMEGLPDEVSVLMWQSRNDGWDAARSVLSHEGPQ